MALPKTVLRRELIEQARHLLARDIFSVEEGVLQTSSQTQRRTYEFGHRYAHMLKDDYSYQPIPKFLQTLCQAAVWNLQNAAGESLPCVGKFKNCIVSVYDAGFKLQPHVDVDETRALTSNGEQPIFHFGDKIVGVVIEADKEGQLYLMDATKREELAHAARQPLGETDGTAYLLSGPARKRFHGVSTVAHRRVSVTYRTVVIG